MANILKNTFRHFSSTRRFFGSTSLKTIECNEVQIPVPWGHVAGKWWGPKDKRPTLVLHGWLDNCGSFDRLIPLLPSHLSYLAIDLPGHGHSSHLPPGTMYHMIDGVHLINLIKAHYQWKHISLMGHSFGSSYSFLYSSLYNDNCDFFIGIDLVRPVIRKGDEMYQFYKLSYEKLLAIELNKITKKSYEKDELFKKIVKDSRYSITPETVECIAARGIKETESNRYCFRRDERLEVFNLGPIDRVILYEMLKQLKTPYLNIKASKSIYYEDKKHFDESIETLRENNNFFEHFVMEGNHHIHLTNPEVISELISNFIIKYRKE